jgi:hypothetical protein
MTKSLAAALRIIAAALPDLVRDLAGLGGVALIAYGAWLIYPPAGYIVGGVLLVIGALLRAMAQTNKAG